MSSFEPQGFHSEYSSGTAETHYIDTPEQVALQFTVAGVGSRFVAVLLDHLLQIAFYIVELLLFIWIATFAAATGHSGSSGSPTSDTAAKWFVAFIILANFSVYVGYFAFFEAYWKGQTPGKRVMKLRVIKDSGRQITFFEALARNLLRIVDYLPGFYLVGVISILCNQSNKRIGDFAAGTIVIHERLEDQPLLVQPTSMFHNLSQPANQPIDPWRTTSPALFPADAIAKLTQQDLIVIEAFFTRALDLTLEMRATMALRIAQQMTAKMGVSLPEGNPERALESIAYAMRSSGRNNW